MSRFIPHNDFSVVIRVLFPTIHADEYRDVKANLNSKYLLLSETSEDLRRTIDLSHLRKIGKGTSP